MPREPFTTKLDRDLMKEVKKLAIDLDCSVNDIIEYCLKAFLKDPYKENKIETKRKSKHM